MKIKGYVNIAAAKDGYMLFPYLHHLLVAMEKLEDDIYELEKNIERLEDEIYDYKRDKRNLECKFEEIQDKIKSMEVPPEEEVVNDTYIPDPNQLKLPL